MGTSTVLSLCLGMSLSASTPLGPAAGTNTYKYDQGTATNSIGLSSGGGLVWLHAFDAVGGADIITEVSSTYGTTFQSALTPGQAVTICIWDDPTNDMNPADAVLLHSQTDIAANENTGLFTAYSLPGVAVSGVFFVGVAYDNLASEPPAGFDESVASGGRAWFTANTSASGGYAALDLANLLNNDILPVELDALGIPAVWMLRAEGEGSLGTKYCSANANSTGSPADISASGSASSAAGDLTLTAAPVPNQPGLMFHGASPSAIPFGNGFLCTMGAVRRGAIIVATGNVASYTYDNSGAARNLGSHVNSNRNFQFWHRDPMGGGAQFNLSNAISIDILP